jgi:hypothetical protein
MELHCRHRQRRVLDRHDHTALRLRRHLKRSRQAIAEREERVIAAGRELGRQALEEPPAQHADP